MQTTRTSSVHTYISQIILQNVCVYQLAITMPAARNMLTRHGEDVVKHHKHLSHHKYYHFKLFEHACN